MVAPLSPEFSVRGPSARRPPDTSGGTSVRVDWQQFPCRTCLVRPCKWNAPCSHCIVFRSSLKKDGFRAARARSASARSRGDQSRGLNEERAKMKKLDAIAMAFCQVGGVGCEQKTGTAPGTNPNKPVKLTLRLAESQTITQDKTDDMTVNISRTEFKDPVTLEVKDLPKGVEVVTKDLTIPADKTMHTITLKAAPDAPPVTDHVIKIIAKGGGAESDGNVKLTVKAKS